MTPVESVRMSGISKRFGRTLALDQVDLNVRPGEIHAIVGENGAGKSTLMSILTGAEQPDAGHLWLQGQPFAPRGPLDSLRAGIACVYQEFNLAGHLSVLANLLLGRERTRCGWLAGELRGDQRRLCRQTLDRLGLAIPLDAPVRTLGVADQQLVEIARALLSQPRVMILDEPTSALAAAEVDRLFAILHQLRQQGLSILYISHFLEEIQRLADRLTILRDGRTVTSGAITDFDTPRIVQAMVGRRVDQMYPRIAHSIGPMVLRVDGLAGSALPRSASLQLHRGQILGIAGLVGAGRTETLRTLFGLDPTRGGTVQLNGVRIAHWSPHHWIGQHLGLLSEDRKDEGLARQLPASANITLAALSRVSRLGFVRRRAEQRQATQAAASLSTRWASADQKVAMLSGGNQQKVALARMLFSDCDVLLLDEPTRGIDVAAKVDVYRAIGQMAATGKAIVMVSSYLPELLGVCDSIAVMCRGVLGPSRPTAELTADAIMHQAVGN